MITPEIELHKIECYIVVSKATGAKTGLMRSKSNWHGMIDLESVLPGGGTLIVDTPERTGFAWALSGLLDLDKSAHIDGVVIKGSPSLLLELSQAQGDAAAPEQKP